MALVGLISIIYINNLQSLIIIFVYLDATLRVLSCQSKYKQIFSSTENAIRNRGQQLRHASGRCPVHHSICYIFTVTKKNLFTVVILMVGGHQMSGFHSSDNVELFSPTGGCQHQVHCKSTFRYHVVSGLWPRTQHYGNFRTVLHKFHWSYGSILFWEMFLFLWCFCNICYPPAIFSCTVPIQLFIC